MDEGSGKPGKTAEEWKNEGNTFYKSGRFQEALDCYDQALILNPRLPEVWYNKSMVLKKMNKSDQSEKCQEIYQQLVSQNGVADETIPGVQGSEQKPEEPPFWKTPPVAGKKNPEIAAVLSFFWPGLGQSYNGQYAKAVLLLIIEWLGVALFFIPTAIAMIFGTIDAYMTSKKMNNREIPYYKTNIKFMTLFALIPVVLVIVVVILNALYGGILPSGTSQSQFHVSQTPYPSVPAPGATKTIQVTPPPVGSLEQVKKNALVLPYDTVFRHIDSYNGKAVYFRGKILQVFSTGGNNYDLRIGTSEPGYNEDIYYVHYSGPTRPVEDRIVDVWGQVDGVINYNSVMGTLITAPEITALDIVPYSTDPRSQYSQLPQTYANPSDLSTDVYRNPTYGYSVLYPESWEKSEGYNSYLGYNFVRFTLKGEDPQGIEEDIADFYISARPVRSNLEDDFTSLVAGLTSGVDVIVTSHTAATKIDNYPGQKIEFSVKDENGKVKSKNYLVMTVIKGKEYFLLFSAKPDYFEDNYEYIQSMIYSFTL